jgi:hypothetical protein
MTLGPSHVPPLKLRRDPFPGQAPTDTQDLEEADRRTDNVHAEHKSKLNIRNTAHPSKACMTMQDTLTCPGIVST